METGGQAVEARVEGRLGVIALNRPERLNALTLDMVRAISAQLHAWRDDPQVRAVLFRSAHERGFCSGGDVRHVREQILAGDTAAAFTFFDEEYAMNGQIAASSKPVIAICDGVVMGGGIGIAGHADFRFASTRSRFAMPESAIGFFCDVGANAILARAPPNRALLFLMTGTAVSGADAMALGLTDCVLPADALDEVEKAIGSAVASDHPQTALTALMQAQVIESGEAEFCADADLVDEELTLPTAAEIVAALTEAGAAYPHIRDRAALMQTRCPASLEAIVQSQQAARRLNELEAVLDVDRRLARFMAARWDFDIGIVHTLIERKPGPANWSPEGFDRVISAAVAEEIAAVEDLWRHRALQHA